ILMVSAGCGQVQFQGSPPDTGIGPKLNPCQGLSGKECQETETQYNLSQQFQATAPLTKTDILFIIDNSGSMEVEQQNIGNSFSQFINLLDSISGGHLDYRIAIATTDMSADAPMKGGRLVTFKNTSPARLYLDKSVSNRVASFYETVQLNKDLDPAWKCSTAPTTPCPSGDERGTYAALTAINRNEGGWMRSDAALAVVILSDEDVRSTGGRTVPDSSTYVPLPLEAGKDNAQDVVDAINAKFGASKKRNVHSLIVKPNDAACMDAQAQQTFPGHEGAVYAKLSRITGGIIGNICETPYDQQVSAIGQVIQTSLNSFQLQCLPMNGYIQVEYLGGQTSSTYQLNGTQLSFSPSLPSDTEFIVRYSCAKTP
ncbi:MAG: hypothetical protein K2X47_19715, partial [Bdellovibrionales bacterium]|nr:hypothetical protein [Bdellovibrionales bacterium]